MSIWPRLQAAITEAGGEYRSVKTLANYRETALWVSPVNGGNFRWMPGISFTVHNEARQAGLTYDQFAANPAASKRQGREEFHGKPMSDTTPDRAISGWTPEQKTEAARSLISDPEVANKVFTDSDSKVRAMEAIHRDDQLKHFNPLPPSQPYPHLSEDPDETRLDDHASRVLEDRADIALAIGAMQRVLGRGSDLGDGRDAVESDLDRLARYLSAAVQLVAGKSVDEEFAEFLGRQS